MFGIFCDKTEKKFQLALLAVSEPGSPPKMASRAAPSRFWPGPGLLFSGSLTCLPANRQKRGSKVDFLGPKSGKSRK